MVKQILIPLLNPNEPEAHLITLYVAEKQFVRQGDLLCTLETTKSTAELLAEKNGYILGLRVQAGQTVSAGEVLGYLAESENESIEAANPIQTPSNQEGGEQIPVGLRITQPALLLAQQHHLDLNQLPKGIFITENWIQAQVQDQPMADEFLQTAGSADPTAIIVYGGGGHGKAVIELIQAAGLYHLVGVVDDGLEVGDRILDQEVLGGQKILRSLYRQGVGLAVNAVGGIGNLAARIQVFEKLAQVGFTCPSIVHPSAYVEKSARLSAGVQLFAQAYIGSDARIGYGCIVNTGAIVSHDCILGDYTNISPGAILAGEVVIGNSVLVGMGATINLRTRIGSGVRIGNSATVKSDVPDQGIVRAGTIWPG